MGMFIGIGFALNGLSIGSGGDGEPSLIGGPFNPGSNVSLGGSSGVWDFSKTWDFTTFWNY